MQNAIESCPTGAISYGEEEAESVGVIPILYGDDPNYDGLQTDDWKDIPILVKKCVKSR